MDRDTELQVFLKDSVTVQVFLSYTVSLMEIISISEIVLFGDKDKVQLTLKGFIIPLFEHIYEIERLSNTNEYYLLLKEIFGFVLRLFSALVDTP